MDGFWEKFLMPMLNFVVFSLYPAPLGLVRATEPGTGSRGMHSGFETGLRSGGGPRLGRIRNFRGHAAGPGMAGPRRTFDLSGWTGHRAGPNVLRTGRDLAGIPKKLSQRISNLDRVLDFPGLACGAISRPVPDSRRPAALAVVAARLLLALRFRHPLWSALLHPFGECFVLGLGLASWWARRSGRGVTWKGRRYQHT